MKCQIYFQSTKQTLFPICDYVSHLIILAIYIPEQRYQDGKLEQKI